MKWYNNKLPKKIFQNNKWGKRTSNKWMWLLFPYICFTFFSFNKFFAVCDYINPSRSKVGRVSYICFKIESNKWCVPFFNRSEIVCGESKWFHTYCSNFWIFLTEKQDDCLASICTCYFVLFFFGVSILVFIRYLDPDVHMSNRSHGRMRAQATRSINKLKIYGLSIQNDCMLLM